MSAITEDHYTYAEMWADEINETYECENDFLGDSRDDGEDAIGAEIRVLRKAAAALRYGRLATFTGGELDFIRHRMPVHQVHQSGSVRWLLDYEEDRRGELTEGNIANHRAWVAEVGFSSPR
jgi:hypothetical protein